MTNQVLGYARVSTGHQTLHAQTDALTAAGCVRVFEDVMTGARQDRPGLARLLDQVRAGDTVVVTSLDRLGRSLSGIFDTIETLKAERVALRSLREGLDYSTPTGQFTATIFAALAQYERELNHERAAAARAAAKQRGKTGGRPAAMGADAVRQARALRAAGESPTAIAKTLGVGRSTVYRALTTEAARAGGL